MWRAPAMDGRPGCGSRDGTVCRVVLAPKKTAVHALREGVTASMHRGRVLLSRVSLSIKQK